MDYTMEIPYVYIRAKKGTTLKRRSRFEKKNTKLKFIEFTAFYTKVNERIVRISTKVGRMLNFFKFQLAFSNNIISSPFNMRILHWLLNFESYFHY